MLRLTKIIQKTLSVRISLMVVFAMAMLLMASMVVMLHYSRKAVKEEAVQNALQTLDGAIFSVDNVMLSVEQTTGNMIFNLMQNINNPDEMFTFAQKIVETNPWVAGCAIAYREYYYPDRKLFMAYVHRADSAGIAYAGSKIVRDYTFGDRPYTQQAWYQEPMKGKMGWVNPLVGMVTDEDPIITFSLPLRGRDGKTACVIGVDVSLRLLSRIVSEAKPSDNSYCTLLDQDGAYLVHPDGSKLIYQTALRSSDPQAKEAAKAMMSGETGYKPFKLNGTDYYIFYKPFKRTAVPGREAESFGWSAGVIYPEDDIFGNYNNLLYYVLAITLISLLLVFLLCRLVIHRQLTPLTMLSRKARRIAEGNYDEPIPASKKKDEIGRLQDNFKLMQQSLATHIDELEKLKETLKIHGADLREAYAQARQADSMKTAFLHNMTNQMIAPAEKIQKDVMTLSDSSKIKKQEASQLVANIQEEGNFIAELLNNLLRVSNDMGKEASHD